MRNSLYALRDTAVAKKNNFANPDIISDEDFETLTSITKAQFEELFTYCDPVQDINQSIVKRKDLLTFLGKFRQDLSDKFLKILFGYSSRQAVSMAISIVRRSLMLRFVPQNIGLNSITRSEFCETHVTEFVNELYNNEPNIPKAIVIVDGTYSYIEKSGHYKCLR